MRNLSLVVAVSENGVIGSKGEVPWRVPTDVKRFRDLTLGHPVIMGRRTHEHIGKALPGRFNVVLSTNSEYVAASGCVVVSNFDEALEIAYQQDDTIFAIGGSAIFEAALQKASFVYLTRIHAEVDGDTFLFLNLEEWREIMSFLVPANDKDEYSFTFLTLERGIT